ncbi:790_t:CDS:2, partial [Racocetra persica]
SRDQEVHYRSPIHQYINLADNKETTSTNHWDILLNNTSIRGALANYLQAQTSLGITPQSIAQAEQEKRNRQQNQFWMQYFAQPAFAEETEFQKEKLNSQEVYTIGQLELEEEHLLTSEDHVET